MNRFACAVKAKFMVTQRKHADDLSDRRNAATNCSHAENEAQGVLRVASSQWAAQLEKAKCFGQRLMFVCLSSFSLEAAHVSNYAKLTQCAPCMRQCQTYGRHRWTKTTRAEVLQWTHKASQTEHNRRWNTKLWESQGARGYVEQILVGKNINTSAHWK